MATGYKAVLWNRQKKQYDLVMLVGIVLFLIVFIGSHFILQPEVTIETLIIRSTGILSLIMLHIILCIGPLSRLDDRFMLLLYNRRHMGVTMAIFALIHGAFSIIQFHSWGNVHPLISLFTSNTHYGSIMRFPFQPLGFFALLILLLMAATSHDFWLKNLGPKVWKSMHMMVYVAYGLLLMHVMLGIVQLEQSPVFIILLGTGMLTLIGLHLLAAFQSARGTQIIEAESGFVPVCNVEDIEDNQAKMVVIGRENIAIFKYDGKLSAVDNACKHQNGPLGEGRIVDGCIVCPWHGYQYHPEDGCSPPPFQEKVATYELKLEGNTVCVNPIPKAEGTMIEALNYH
jgi:nitrite reductase/ring-hydroxylating ferredoxin subunit/DMSO/TMAO reductase YedYZ heme-binding membrane subunit